MVFLPANANVSQDRDGEIVEGVPAIFGGEMSDPPSQFVGNEMILKVAKNLQGSYSRQTTGEPRKWRDVPDDERTIWIKLARTAARVLTSGTG